MCYTIWPVQKCTEGGIYMEGRISKLREILDDSKYTVAICGSGMMEEGGFIGVKNLSKAYEIEEKYGYSSEEIFSSAFYNTRPEFFFDFYKKEMLENCPEDTASGPALAAMERAGKLQCIITSNIYAKAERAGCKNVVNLHGTIYQNKCPRCGKEYTMEQVRDAKKVLLCENCDIPVRPQVSLFGEMVDSRLMTKTTNEISKAEVLLLLGTNLDSEVFVNYMKYFTGRWLVIVHPVRHYLDNRADMLLLDYPKNILPLLGY